MDSTVQHDAKRPRLNWSPTGPPSLPSTSQYQTFTPRTLEQQGAGPLPPPLDDRRRHDSESYGSAQDHSRTPSTPTHPLPFSSSFSLRDSSIKREPGDDPSTLARRPQSMGNVSDIMAATPNPLLGPAINPGSNHNHKKSNPISGPTPPSPFPEDHRRHMSLDAGTHFRQPTYQVPPALPHPHPHGPTYETAGFAPHPGDLYTVYSASSASSTKRKATRASQACDSCRQLKAKCDETKPCKSCKEKGFECKYRDPIPKATDKAQADILDGINDVKQMMRAFTTQLTQVRDRVARIESTMQPGNSHSDLKGEEIFTRHDSDFKLDSPFEHGAAHVQSFLSSPDAQVGPQYDQGAVQPIQDEEEELEGEPGPPVAPGQPAIPINHTTLAGLLLGWPAVKGLVQNLLEKERIEYVAEYPIRQEQERGLLRVYGRGEGHDSRWSKEDHGMLDVSDEASDISSPAADWGQLGSGSFDPKIGSFAFDNSPDFSPDVVASYIKSFKDHILLLHPIIMPKELSAMVQAFQDGLVFKSGSKAGSTPVMTKGFAVNSSIDSANTKRKRSPSPEGIRTNSLSTIKLGRPHRTITNAVVLLAMALGKVCQFRDCIPDVAPSSVASYESPLIRNGVPASPTLSSPPGTSSRSVHSGLPSPNDFDHRRMSQGAAIMGRPTNALKKNYETIPGLEYFALATDIIGNQLGGTSIKHVWAGVLAGLYHGQLGRVMESYAYISNGSKILQIILRPSLDRLRKIRHNAPQEVIIRKRDNQLAFAYWTCLQLESDILAELPLPHSGILAYEDDIPYPNLLLTEDSYEPRIFESYMAQLYLRRHLNSIHTMFYHPNANIQLGPSDEDFSDMHVVQDRVRTMRWVSPSFRFNEDDQPADDILAARLRAKYWGAQVITYRPFIRQILQFTADLKANSGGTVDHARYSAELNPRAIEYARLGIRALIESTRAFHNLGQDRPIITNVFGTAHAQWGNMLVLSAIYLDPFLGQFVEGELLQHLFARTLNFLRRSSTNSCNLRRDMRILEGVERQIFNPRFKNVFSDAPPSSMLAGGLSLQQPASLDSVTRSSPGRPPPPPPPPHPTKVNQQPGLLENPAASSIGSPDGAGSA